MLYKRKKFKDLSKKNQGRYEHNLLLLNKSIPFVQKGGDYKTKSKKIQVK